MVRRSSLGVLGYEQTRPHLVMRRDQIDWLNQYAEDRQMTFSAACSALLAWAVDMTQAEQKAGESRRSIERAELEGMGAN